MICGCEFETKSIHEVRKRSKLSDSEVILYCKWFSNFFRETDPEAMTGKCRFCGTVHELSPRFMPGRRYRFSREKFIQHFPEYDSEVYDEIMAHYYGKTFKLKHTRLRHKIGKSKAALTVIPEYCDLIE